MRRIWHEIAESSAARIYSLVVGLAILFLSARILGPGGRGDMVAVMNWAMLFSTLGGLSLGQVAIHRATVLRERPWLGETLGSLLLIAGTVSVGSWLLIACVYAPTRGSAFKGLSPQLLIIAFAALPFLIWEQYGSSLLTALGQIRIYNRAQILGRSIGLVTFLVLILGLKWGVFGALVATLLSQVTVALTGLGYMIKRADGRLLPNAATIRELVSGGCKLHLNAIGAFIYTSTDVLLIHRYRGANETGFYQMAVQMSAILLLVPQAAAMVLFGKLAQLGADGLWPQQKRVLLGVTAAMAAAAAIGAVLAPTALPLVAGKAFTPSVGILQLLLLGLIGASFTTLMGPQWIGRGLLWQTAAITLAGGLMNFAANCVLVPKYGMYGSVTATLGTYVFSVLINLGMFVWVARRSTENRLLSPDASA